MTSDSIPYYLDPATILDELCPSQLRVCEEFTQTTNKEVFERVVNLVNEIADAGRLNNSKNRDTLEQAVYKIALLAQGMGKYNSGAAECEFNVIWNGITPAPRQFVAVADPPPSDNPVFLAPMPVGKKVSYYKRQRARKQLLRSMLEAAD
jgi:hypothetical protein